ncbi:MAG: hypothetical protein IPJ85_04195 [Flavobacteriales bacterium]|nr:hypothetical protein [Flavobacteriales bacterium]
METINDRLNEWFLLDSADFSVPEHGRRPLPQNTLRADLAMQSVRSSAYLQAHGGGKTKRIPTAG